MRMILFWLLGLFGFSAVAQCHINTYIEDNYTLDAKILALRDILADSSDPDYDNPFLPEGRVTPYLELLSGIYENPNNDSDIDMLFNDFNFHVNQEYMYPIEYKTLVFRVPTALSWVEGFKNTGISGIPELDNLMTTYQFTVDDFWEFNTCSCTIFFLKTGFDFLNLYALIDDFEVVENVEYADVYVQDFDLRFNYTGIPYTISGEDVSVCDITVQYNTTENNYLFTFTLYGGDCPAGCTVSETRFVYVDENCQPLSTKENTFYSFKIYPNPTSDFVTFSTLNDDSVNVIVYNLEGKNILTKALKNKTLDVSNLKQGVYFLRINQGSQTEIKKLVVK